MLLAPEGKKGGVWGSREPGSGGLENSDQSQKVSFHSFTKLIFFNVKTLRVRVNFLHKSLDLQITLEMDASKIFKAT